MAVQRAGRRWSAGSAPHSGVTLLVDLHRSFCGELGPVRFMALYPCARALLAALVAVLMAGSAKLHGQQRGRPVQARIPGVTVQGEVIDHETGGPVRGAAVSLTGGISGSTGLGTRVTNAAGRFLFRDVAAGSYRLTVSILAYRDMVDTVHVAGSADIDLVLPLSVDPVRLEPILVTGERAFPGRRGMVRRGQAAFTVTRQQIEDRHPFYVTDLLVLVPGGRILRGSGAGNRLLLRGSCLPGIWIDGIRMPDGGRIDRLIGPNDIEALEVYHALELPVELGSHPCGGIVVWTRVGPSQTTEGSAVPDSGRGSFWRRLAMASGLFLMAVFAIR